ncbi:MAG: autotransporter outer membrane beta-barrel domain-containing protein [Deltaproteobacteria bacterium]|jgi:hypothetical protein|nr:autotransporter outer membrane beta-barrel domain-containing protein [Deltaproteobacteria bacterium]
MARMDFGGPGPGGAYLEASGRVRTDYGSGDLRSEEGVAASYELASSYYGAHAGIGYAWVVSDMASLEVYAKYVWTRQEGGTARLSAGEPVAFEDADSSRVRVGWKLSCRPSARASLYAGAAYEREADGRWRPPCTGCPYGGRPSAGERE